MSLTSIRAYAETCQYRYAHSKERCRYPREHHGDPPDHIKHHVGPVNDHPFEFDAVDVIGRPRDRYSVVDRERDLLLLLDLADAVHDTPFLRPTTDVVEHPGEFLVCLRADYERIARALRALEDSGG
jgi:hypothetical protein